MTRESNLALAAYVRSIRNPAKKDYAQAVAAYGPESAQAEALRPTLSYMGAQAVRMQIADIEASTRQHNTLDAFIRAGVSKLARGD